jgi:hypothetical protein
MKKRTDKIIEQLGMPLGTASNKLKKNILFELVKTCGLNKCFRCNNTIENVNEFSIEHKESWFDSNDPKGLFFNIDNIAYSHLKCNSGAAKQKIRNKKNKIGYRGVTIDKRRLNTPYQAKIWDGNKWIKSKNFVTPVEAAKEYDKLAISIFGSKALTNKMLGKLP